MCHTPTDEPHRAVEEREEHPAGQRRREHERRPRLLDTLRRDPDTVCRIGDARFGHPGARRLATTVPIKGRLLKGLLEDLAGPAGDSIEGLVWHRRAIAHLFLAAQGVTVHVTRDGPYRVDRSAGDVPDRTLEVRAQRAAQALRFLDRSEIESAAGRGARAIEWYGRACVAVEAALVAPILVRAECEQAAAAKRSRGRATRSARKAERDPELLEIRERVAVEWSGRTARTLDREAAERYNARHPGLPSKARVSARMVERARGASKKQRRRPV